ncbi:hypothetical protein BDD12DRAFT_808232 [Trichophaea hybrida]|nr:hypothetical protein BDD12DRAFT_808232 [Trichophaea hybrida]
MAGECQGGDQEHTYGGGEWNVPQETLRSLMWLAFSERPLRIEELAEAIVLNPQSDPYFDPEERFPDPHNILRILGSLVTISPSPDAAEKIRLTHFSVKEYLLSSRICLSSAAKFGFSDVAANHFIAESWSAIHSALRPIQFQNRLSRRPRMLSGATVLLPVLVHTLQNRKPKK